MASGFNVLAATTALCLCCAGVAGAAGRDGADAPAYGRFGFDEASSDWRSVVARPDIDVVDICTPNNVHAEIAIAAAKAGKHIICEKPLARTVEEARAMTEAAKAAGIIHHQGNSVIVLPAESQPGKPAFQLAHQ